MQSAWLETLGRLHVAVVHFPIALLIIAAMIEGWATLRGRERNPATVMLLTLGLLFAGLSAVSGWYHAGTDAWDFDVKKHFVAGVISSAFTLLALLAILFREKEMGRALIFAAAIGVSVTGHFGGELTHGKGYLTELIFQDTSDGLAGAGDASATPQPTLTSAQFAEAEADFDAKVKPILAAACFECHGPAKHSASLRLDSLTELHSGGKSGVVVVAGKSDESLIIQRVLGEGGKKRMPPDRDPLTPEQIQVLREWIDKDRTAPTVVEQKWIATVEPKRPKVISPIDLLLGDYYKSNNITPSEPVSDRIFARRAYLDVIGLIPTPAELQAFEEDTHPDKRNRLVRALLDDERRYAEHWMSFWNDALRNDYAGTGYIDGGRQQITQWLYKALAENMPFDEFVTQLIDPVPGSEGFTNGIVWRGAVSQSQRPELQAAQNISQVFLGINMKCASCHDSFINDWKLADAYGLASVFSDAPLKQYLCEKDTGEVAQAAFIYPELGSIDPDASKEKRTERLAELITSPDNGRLARTIVNRLWARFMGRGLVEPVDEMDHEPWNIDLLDWLAVDLMDNGYNLKHTIMMILTSDAYQMQSVGMQDPSQKGFTFQGPVVKRMSAEQFCDSVNDLIGGGFVNAAPPIDGVNSEPAQGKWIWSIPGAFSDAPAESILLWKTFELDEKPVVASIGVNCDNESLVYINGKQVVHSKKFNRTEIKDVSKHLVPGRNVIFVRAYNFDVKKKNLNPAAFWATLSMKQADGSVRHVGTDSSWQARADVLPAWPVTLESLKSTPAAVLTEPEDRKAQLDGFRKMPLATYRAVWAKNNALMSALGRPTREQTLTERASAATTLQALEMTNGKTLAELLERGGRVWADRPATDEADRVQKLYYAALGREPSPDELTTALEVVKDAGAAGYADLLWAILMMPEFQLIY